MVVMPQTEINFVIHSRFNRVIFERIADRLTLRTVEVPAKRAGRG
jgi:hypothetical protein